MRTEFDKRLAAVTTAAAAALILTACGPNGVGEVDSETQAGDTPSATESSPAASESADESYEDKVSVAAITDEGAGADGEWDGLYDSNFRAEADRFDGDRVTLSATVNEIISDEAFTIGGIDAPDVEPLLVLHTKPMSFVDEGDTVLVTGVVHNAYTTEAAEVQLGTELDMVEFEEWEQQPYIETDTVGELREPA